MLNALCLMAIFVTHPPTAVNYMPPSLSACLSTAKSAYAQSQCYEHEIAKLSTRLPPGSGVWRKTMESECYAKYAQDGTARAEESAECILQATARKAGVQ
jgi:hypothetical protein